MEETELLTVKQAADYLKVSLDTLKRWRNRKHLPLPAIHLSRQEVRIRKSDLLTWVEKLGHIYKRPGS